MKAIDVYNQWVETDPEHGLRKSAGALFIEGYLAGLEAAKKIAEERVSRLVIEEIGYLIDER